MAGAGRPASARRRGPPAPPPRTRARGRAAPGRDAPGRDAPGRDASGREEPEILDDVDGPERLQRLLPRVSEALTRPRGRRAPPADAVAKPVDLTRAAVVFPSGRVPVLTSGGTAKTLGLSRPRLEELVRAALAVSDRTPSVVWVRGDSELAVHADRTRVALGKGTLVVGVRVECDQTGPAEVAVPFALGSDDLRSGLVMAVPARADGPPLVVEQWGAVIVAAVYRALLDVMSAVAASAGIDRDGMPLIPGAVSTDGATLTVVPQARHAVDRGRLL